MVKNPPANAGEARDADLIPALGILPGVGVGTQSNILTWKIPWTEEPGGLQSMGHKDLDMTEHTQPTTTCGIEYHRMRLFFSLCER